jgi:hypothetical protein
MTEQEHKLERQRLLEIERKKQQKYGYGNEWDGKRDVRNKVRYSRKMKHVGRFRYDLEEEGD